MNFDAERESSISMETFSGDKTKSTKRSFKCFAPNSTKQLHHLPNSIQRIHELLKILLFGVHTTEKQFAMTFLSVS